MVRYRIDGVLYESRKAPRQFMPSIISRVKIMAGLNIAEKRLPQDGRIRRKIAGKDIDMRVATVPTVKAGERITIRLLDRESVLHDLADIGFGDDHLRQIDELIHKPARHHAGHRAHRLGQDDHALRLPGQDQLARPQHPHHRGPGRVPAGRHLPDRGEREDRSRPSRRGCARSCATTPTSSWSARSAIGETAEIAIQASLTGHLVLSTIHTNDAAGAITRLVDLGVQPFLSPRR